MTWFLFLVFVATPASPPTVTTLDLGNDGRIYVAMEKAINSTATENGHRQYAWCYRGKKP